MTSELVVLMGEAIAGTLTESARGLELRYDDAYRARNAPTPLSVTMPVQVQVHGNRVVTPWLRGLLPDNEAVLARWARQFHAAASSPFSLLSTPVGEDCAGAVRFAPPDELARMLGRPGTVRRLTDAEVAQRLRDLRTDTTAWLGADFTGQFSLAGAQAKTALVHDGDRWGLPTGRAATSHILKPAIAHLDDHDLNEHLCLDAARRAGLVAARTRIERFEDVGAVVVERYDRVRVDHGYERVHQEDLCQALGFPPSRKYQNQGGPSPASIAKLLRRVMPARIAQAAVLRFLDALAWSWLIAGTDAHAKNYSLLLAGDEIRLAPLYDVASALPYLPEQKLALAMKLGGSYRLRSHTPSTWTKVASELGLPADAVVERVRHLAGVLPDAFRDAAAQPDVRALASPLPRRLLDCVSARAASSARILTATE
jgi:serine/threonine-protein kinase HipA